VPVWCLLAALPFCELDELLWLFFSEAGTSLFLISPPPRPPQPPFFASTNRPPPPSQPAQDRLPWSSILLSHSTVGQFLCGLDPFFGSPGSKRAVPSYQSLLPSFFSTFSLPPFQTEFAGSVTLTISSSRDGFVFSLPLGVVLFPGRIRGFDFSVFPLSSCRTCRFFDFSFFLGFRFPLHTLAVCSFLTL